MGAHGALVLAEFYERREREVILTFSESMRLRDGPAVRHVDSFLKVDRREFLRSAMFNEILRQVNDHQRLFVAVREGVRGLGGMLLGRGQHDPPFTGDEAIKTGVGRATYCARLGANRQSRC